GYDERLAKENAGVIAEHVRKSGLAGVGGRTAGLVFVIKCRPADLPVRINKVPLPPGSGVWRGSFRKAFEVPPTAVRRDQCCGWKAEHHQSPSAPRQESSYHTRSVWHPMNAPAYSDYNPRTFGLRA